MVYQFEIIGILFALFMIYLTYVQYKREAIGKYALYFWAVFWFAGALLIIIHRFVNSLLPPLNIIRVMDLYMILAFMFLFAVAFYFYIRLNKTSKRIEELARIVTLRDIEIPSNLVTLQSGISNRHSRTKGDTINGNVYVKNIESFEKPLKPSKLSKKDFEKNEKTRVIQSLL